MPSCSIIHNLSSYHTNGKTPYHESSNVSGRAKAVAIGISGNAKSVMVSCPNLETEYEMEYGIGG